MTLKKWEIALIAAVVITLLMGAGLRREQTNLSEKLIRLHVVANSDSDSDQALKLKVRDEISRTAGELLDGVTDRGEAARLIETHMGDMTAAAQSVVYSHGYDYGVSAGLSVETFPTREYDTFSLPAGEYMSLRVVIGTGEGHNWWCVIFPPLCVSAATDAQTALNRLSEEDIRLITEDGPEYVFKFKSIELLQQLKQLLGL